MSLLLFLLNLQYTIVAVVPVVLSIPKNITVIKKALAFIVRVKSFWWAFGLLRHVRGLTISHVILLGPREMKNDLEHELIHVQQHDRYPIVFPILYFYGRIRKGYRRNRFEDEPYTLSNSIYEGKPAKAS